MNSVASEARLPSSAIAEMNGLRCRMTAKAQAMAAAEATNQTTVATTRAP